MWASLPAAIAACIAVIATVGGPRDTGSKITRDPTPAGAQSVDSTTYYRDLDGGVRIVSDGPDGAAQPMRAIRRQVVRQTEWYDPVEKATMRLSVPEERTVYVNAPPF